MVYLMLFCRLCRGRELSFHSEHTEELGNMLLRVSAIGIYAYSLFSMIAGALTPPTTEEPPLLVLINGLLSLIEVTWNIKTTQ